MTADRYIQGLTLFWSPQSHLQMPMDSILLQFSDNNSQKGHFALQCIVKMASGEYHNMQYDV